MTNISTKLVDLHRTYKKMYPYSTFQISEADYKTEFKSSTFNKNENYNSTKC